MSRLTFEGLDLAQVEVELASEEALLEIHKKAVAAHEYNLRQLTYRRNALRRQATENPQ